MAMTSIEFDALVKLMRGSPGSPANIAARRVLVDGISQGDAMRETGVKRPTVSVAVKRYSDADMLIREAYGLNKNSI